MFKILSFILTLFILVGCNSSPSPNKSSLIPTIHNSDINGCFYSSEKSIFLICPKSEDNLGA